MKIATFNANSVRQRLPIIIEWLCEHEPDVLALQETKCEDGKFPIADFEEAGYHVALNGQKGFNGVATISREPLLNVRKGFEDPLFPEDARILIGEYQGVPIINTYVPNGTAVGSDKFDYKLRWLWRFRQMLMERYSPTLPLLWLGDINIAPTSDDVYNPRKFFGGVGHHPQEMEALAAIRDWGLVDCFRKFTQGPGHYTYWDYVILTSVPKNFGWRIDHIYASTALAKLCTGCEVDREPRSKEKPSDHTPVWAEFDV
ncbi:MAG TPA: exodeoxyribonuclease III [Fimbriimonadaceae bacterium]|nr:exodeoxyribonuclease III [Fimbriimonadaceae bacterium]